MRYHRSFNAIRSQNNKFQNEHSPQDIDVTDDSRLFNGISIHPHLTLSSTPCRLWLFMNFALNAKICEKCQELITDLRIMQ